MDSSPAAESRHAELRYSIGLYPRERAAPLRHRKFSFREALAESSRDFDYGVPQLSRRGAMRTQTGMRR
jgi:hypothetical protein